MITINLDKLRGELFEEGRHKDKKLYPVMRQQTIIDFQEQFISQHVQGGPFGAQSAVMELSLLMLMGLFNGEIEQLSLLLHKSIVDPKHRGELAHALRSLANQLAFTETQ